MRAHDIRMALAAIVAFGPVVFAAAYGVANASRLQAASVPTIAAAPVRSAATQPDPGEERAMAAAPQAVYQIAPAAPRRQDVVNAGLDRPASKHQKSQFVR